MLHQQQAPLAEQLRLLQQQQDEATNRLAAANTEIAQLKSGQNQSELLKLRGQVGTLRQQLVSTEAKTNSPSSGLAKMMADPAMKELMRQSSRREIKLRYAELFKELKLSPEQIEKFAQLYANSGLGLNDISPASQGASDNAQALDAADTDVQNRLRALLGEAGYARFNEFTQEVPARTTVKLLNSQLGASQLTDEQGARLLQIVKSEPYDLTYGIEGDVNKVFYGSQDQIDNYLRLVAESNQRVVQQAGVFLTPDQLAALNVVLTNALKARTAQAEALIQKH